MDVKSFDAARVLFYDFLAGVFLYDLLLGREELLKRQVALLQASPLDEAMEIAIKGLGGILEREGIETLRNEYTELFVLPFSHKRIHLLLSHYNEGCVGGQALLDIRQRLRDFPIRMNSDLCKESEEHFGFLMVLMRFLIEHREEIPEGSERRVFEEFIAPYGEKIAQELIHHPVAQAYPKIGQILRGFLEFERLILR